MTFIRSFRVFSISILIIIFAGCQQQQKAPQPQTQPRQVGHLSHVVQYPGETLSIIAGWYTGSPRNWELLMEANPGLDPRRIRIGDSIRIPRELVSRSDPMPRSAVSGTGGAAAKQPSDSGASRQVGSTRSSGVESSGKVAGPSERTIRTGSSVSMRSGFELDDAEGDSAATGGDTVTTTGSWSETVRVEPAPAEEVVEHAIGSQDKKRVEPSRPTGGQEGLRIKSRDELLRELLEE